MGVYKKIMIRRVKSTFGNQEGEIYLLWPSITFDWQVQYNGALRQFPQIPVAGDSWLPTNICSFHSEWICHWEWLPIQAQKLCIPMASNCGFVTNTHQVNMSKSDVISRSGFWEISESSLLSLFASWMWRALRPYGRGKSNPLTRNAHPEL